MGLRTSSLSWFECNPPSPKPKTTNCWNKFSPPSYNHNWTDIHYAASHGNVRRIQEIIHKSGTINLNKKDYYGKTPLYWAAYKGHKACLEELLKFGSDVNTQCRHGGTPLHAVVSLYPECAMLLIKHGADVNKADNWGVTPMYLAACNSQLEVIKYLITGGAQLTYKNKKTGDTPKQLLSHKEFLEHLHYLERNPARLQDQCRVQIRRQLTGDPMERIPKLPLPGSLKDFVALADLR